MHGVLKVVNDIPQVQFQSCRAESSGRDELDSLNLRLFDARTVLSVCAERLEPFQMD